MSGINTGNNDAFVDSFGEEKKMMLSNWYFKDFFGQRKLMFPCEVITAVFLVIMLIQIIGGVVA